MDNETMQTHFGRLAQQYDALRLPEEALTPLIETLVDEGGLRGRRVLDIGCGTGRVLTILSQHYAVQGWGIDLSAEMLATARARIPAGVQMQVAAAEDLPFSDSCFERAVTTTAVHLFDRSRAFPEIWRVLEPGGRLTIMTPDPAAFAGMWMAWLFPSYVEIEQRRFPTAEALEYDLRRAGFARCAWARQTLLRSFSKVVALQKLRERHVSTFVLLDEAEYRAGVEQAERDLPDLVEYTQQTLFVSAERD